MAQNTSSEGSTGHISRAKDPQIVRESQKPLRVVGSIFGLLTVILLVIITVLSVKGCSDRRSAKKAAVANYATTRPSALAATVTIAQEDPEYPSSGNGYATKKGGLKCRLDPMKSYVRPSKPVRYVVADHPSLYVDDYLDRHNDEKWYRMPAGRYILYPLKEGDEVYVRWGTDSSSFQ